MARPPKKGRGSQEALSRKQRQREERERQRRAALNRRLKHQSGQAHRETTTASTSDRTDELIVEGTDLASVSEERDNPAQELPTMTSTAAPTLRDIFDSMATISASDFLNACRLAGMTVHVVPDGAYHPLPTLAGAEPVLVIPGIHSNISALGKAATVVVDDPRRPFLATLMRGAQGLVFAPPKSEAAPPTFPMPKPGFAVKLHVQGGSSLTFMPESFFPGAITTAGAMSSLGKRALSGGRRTPRKKEATIQEGQDPTIDAPPVKSKRKHRVRWYRPSAFAELTFRLGSLKPEPRQLSIGPGTIVHFRDPTHAADVPPLAKGVLHAGTKGLIDAFAAAFVKAGAYAICHPDAIVYVEEGGDVEVMSGDESKPLLFTLNIPRCGSHQVEWAKAVEEVTVRGKRIKRAVRSGVHHVNQILVDGQTAPEEALRSQRFVDPARVGLIFRLIHVEKPSATTSKSDTGSPATPTSPPPVNATGAPSICVPSPPAVPIEVPAPTTIPPPVFIPPLPLTIEAKDHPPANSDDRPITLVVQAERTFVMINGGWTAVNWQVEIDVDPDQAAYSLLTGGKTMVPAVVRFRSATKEPAP